VPSISQDRLGTNIGKAKLKKRSRAFSFRIDAGVRYRLYAVVFHRGSTVRSGHYFASLHSTTGTKVKKKGGAGGRLGGGGGGGSGTSGERGWRGLWCCGSSAKSSQQVGAGGAGEGSSATTSSAKDAAMADEATEAKEEEEEEEGLSSGGGKAAGGGGGGSGQQQQQEASGGGGGGGKKEETWVLADDMIPQGVRWDGPTPQQTEMSAQYGGARSVLLFYRREDG
jgi:hypothetical protein